MLGRRTASGLTLAPLLSLFLSGFGALVLQEVWARSALFVFGSTTVAVTAVLCTFMAGLAIGNGLIAVLLPKIGRPFLCYVVIEVFLAIYSILFSFIISKMVLSPVAVVAGILFPTFCMGLTVPLLISGLPAPLGAAAAYGMNTVGAAAGALAGAFWILPTYGLRGGGWFASFCLLSAAAVTAPLSRRRIQVSESARHPLQDGLQLFSVAFLGGAVGLSLELLWTRLLSLVFGPSVYAIGVVLFVYLAGIGLGAWLCPAVLRRTSARNATAGCLLIGGVSIALSVALIGILPYLFLELAARFQPRPETLHWIEFFLAAVTMLPSALMQGLLPPLLIASREGDAGGRAGWVFSFNTLGAIVGAALTGLWAVPRAGFLPPMICAVTAYLCAGLFLLGWLRHKWLTAACVLLAAVFSFNAGNFWDRAVLAGGVYKYAVGRALRGGRDAKIEIGELLYYKEGITSTVAVTRTGNDRILSIDGKADASAYGDRSTQVLLAALPLSLSKQTDRTLVVGFASGVTAGVASLFPAARVTAVEIEPAVYEAARYFEDVNHGPLASPPHEKIVADARHFLLQTPERFDVITSEPSNPWMSGVAPLFTREFFSLARARLAEGGVMCQWLPIYGMSRDLVASVMKTFSSVFPHVSVFEAAEGYDLLLIGSETPVMMNPSRMEKRWTNAALLQELSAIRVRSGVDLLGRFLMGPQGVHLFSGRARINTDDNGYLEFEAPKSLHLQTAEQNHKTLLNFKETLPSRLTGGMR